MSSSSRRYMSKRQRPCDFCRSRKTACRIEGSLPCRLCTLHGRDCTFVEPAQPRRRPATSATNDFVAHGSTSTPFGSNIFDEGTHAEDIAYGQDPRQAATVSPLSNNSAVSPTHPNEWQHSHNAQGSNQDEFGTNHTNHFFTGYEVSVHQPQLEGSVQLMHEGLSPGNFLPQLDIEASSDWLNQESLQLQIDTNNGFNPQILGHSGDMDPYLLKDYQYDAYGSYKFKQLGIHSVSQGKVPAQFLISNPSLFASQRQELGFKSNSDTQTSIILEGLVSTDTAARLIALFRRFILPQYPIFSEHMFPDPRTSPSYLLAAIYMAAQPLARLDDVLSVELAYENLNNQALSEIVRGALHFESHNPSLSVVQTLLLIILRPSINPLVLESSSKWSIHGTLISTSQTLGLHHDSISWPIAPWQVALRRRLSFVVFSTDRWLAASLGRPPLIHRDSWLVSSLSEADGHSSLLSPEVWSAYLQYCRLSQILDSVLENLFSLRAMHELALDAEKTIDISDRLLIDLSQWHQESAMQSMGHLEETTASLNTVCTLGYHYVHMTISRAILRPFLSYSDPDTVTAEPGHRNPANARTGIRSATTAAGEFLNSLQQEHAQIFWPHWSQVAFSCICFLDLLMATSSGDAQEAMGWFHELNTTRKSIRLKSTMLPVLRLGLLRIDAVFWKGIDRVLQLRPHVLEALKASSDQGNC